VTRRISGEKEQQQREVVLYPGDHNLRFTVANQHANRGIIENRTATADREA